MSISMSREDAARLARNAGVPVRVRVSLRMGGEPSGWIAETDCGVSSPPMRAPGDAMGYISERVAGRRGFRRETAIVVAIAATALALQLLLAYVLFSA